MGFPWIGAFGLLIYLAGLMGISPDIYNAYTIESTSTLRRIWHLDVPLKARADAPLGHSNLYQQRAGFPNRAHHDARWAGYGHVTCPHCACTIRPLYTATSAMGRPLD